MTIPRAYKAATWLMYVTSFIALVISVVVACAVTFTGIPSTLLFFPSVIALIVYIDTVIALMLTQRGLIESNNIIASV